MLKQIRNPDQIMALLKNSSLESPPLKLHLG
jgi:hypothetical protein